MIKSCILNLFVKRKSDFSFFKQSFSILCEASWTPSPFFVIFYSERFVQCRATHLWTHFTSFFCVQNLQAERSCRFSLSCCIIDDSSRQTQTVCHEAAVLINAASPMFVASCCLSPKTHLCDLSCPLRQLLMPCKSRLDR